MEMIYGSEHNVVVTTCVTWRLPLCVFTSIVRPRAKRCPGSTLCSGQCSSSMMMLWGLSPLERTSVFTATKKQEGDLFHKEEKSKCLMPDVSVASRVILGQQTECEFLLISYCKSSSANVLEVLKDALTFINNVEVAMWWPYRELSLRSKAPIPYRTYID